MPSIVVPALKTAVSAATALGVLTVADTTLIYPGSYGWAVKDDGSVQYRVKILQVIDSTTFVARRCNPQRDPNGGPTHDQENFGPPNYGKSDLSALDGGGAHISIEAQTAPIDPAYAKRVLP